MEPGIPEIVILFCKAGLSLNDTAPLAEGVTRSTTPSAAATGETSAGAAKITGAAANPKMEQMEA